MEFLLNEDKTPMLMKEIRFTSYSWSGTYLIVLQVFVHSQVVHDAVFGKQHPAGIFPAGFCKPIDPDFRIPLVRWGDILASYWPKRKRISGSILVHNWVVGLGPGSFFTKSMGNPWFGWFGCYRFRRGIWHWSKLQMFGIGNTEELYHVSDILCQ